MTPFMGSFPIMLKVMSNQDVLSQPDCHDISRDHSSSATLVLTSCDLEYSCQGSVSIFQTQSMVRGSDLTLYYEVPE